MTWIVVILIGVLVILGGYWFFRWSFRPLDRTPDEQADLLERLLSGSRSVDHDGVLSIRIADAQVDRICVRCNEIVLSNDPRWHRDDAELDAEFPDRKSAPPLFWVTDEGIEVIRSCVEELREIAAQRKGER